MKLSNKYKTSEYIFLFSILVLALLLGTYFSFYAFLWRDIESKVKGFSKDHNMNGIPRQFGQRVPSSNIRGLNPPVPGNIPA
jgi:hypothetical protein